MPASRSNWKISFFLIKTACYTFIDYIANSYFANETLLRCNRFVPDEFRCNENDKNDYFKNVVKGYSP